MTWRCWDQQAARTGSLWAGALTLPHAPLPPPRTKVAGLEVGVVCVACEKKIFRLDVAVHHAHGVAVMRHLDHLQLGKRSHMV